MIYECLIAPTESPQSTVEIKRALLTYDKVKLADPADRDIIPANAYMSIIMGAPIFGMSVGAVRPMGKLPGYDNEFQETLDSCKPAIQQGLLEVVSTYDVPKTRGFSIGGVPTGGYPLDTKFVFGLYRSMAQNQVFLERAISAGRQDLEKCIDHSSELSLQGVGDGGINDIPALPLLNSTFHYEGEQEHLTLIARARIAALIKYAGFCENKELVPVFNSSTFGGILSELLNNTHGVLANIEGDHSWIRRNRILELCHEEYLDDSTLDSLSVDQVIRLRTKAWGDQAKARETLFASVAELALSLDSQSLFETKSQALIAEYRTKTEVLVREREKIKFRLKCELGKATLSAGIALGTGLLAQLISPTTMGLTLAAGGIWAFDKSKEYVPALKELKARELEYDRGAGFGIHNFYSRVK